MNVPVESHGKEQFRYLFRHLHETVAGPSNVHIASDRRNDNTGPTGSVNDVRLRVTVGNVRVR